MPLTSILADALGLVTISLVTLLTLIGLLIIFYSIYFRNQISNQPHTHLKYFIGPWLIRILFISFSIFCGFNEIIRLGFLRQNGRILHNSKWQQTVCKYYIVSNLGFSEPCLFLTLIFLLRASLQHTNSGPLSQKWNMKTMVYVLLGFLPLLVLQTTVVFIGPRYETDHHLNKKGYFFKTTTAEYEDDVASCYYPLLSTIFLGVFATVLTFYLFWLGRRILILVINKGLQKRVYTLIFLVSSFFPLRVLLLGLSVLFKPGDAVFEVISFLAFLLLLCCSGVGICVLVYYPIADSLALKNVENIGEYETRSLIDTGSTKQGSISFGMIEREFVELSLFSPSQHLTPIGSPEVHGWPYGSFGDELVS